MIKEALQYVVGLKKPEIFEFDGERYSDKELRHVHHNPKADSINMVTLTGLVDYIKSGADSLSDKMFVQVTGPKRVRLISQLDRERERETVVTVECEVPHFNFDGFMGREEFNIALQSVFVPGDDRDTLLRFVGTVQSKSIAEYGDDGVSQKATIKKGIAGSEDAIVPGRVKLRPYRTFMEVEQPESEFVFRMKEDERGIRCAIFEADGGAWKNAAMKTIKEYLEYELADYPNFIVIS